MIKEFKDGLMSLTNQLINKRSASLNNVISHNKVDYHELRSMYKSGIGSKIIRLKSGAALNDTLQFASIEDKKFYDNRVAAHVKLCTLFMLAFGRSIIVIHDKGADLGQPLIKDFDPDAVKYHVFSGDMVYIQSVNTDLSSVNYFKPIAFSVRAATIHPSRVIDFTYVRPVEHDAPNYQYGGISEFELIRDEIVNDQIVQRAVPVILEKSSTLFYSIKGFKDLLAEKRESELVAYIQSIENLRSIQGAGIIDSEDSVDVVSQSLTNLAESDMITLRRIAMVTGIPLSWLVGEAARGMNATGEGEKQVFISTIKYLQSDYLITPINQLMKIHGREPAHFKKNQGDSANESVDYEQKVIANARILWEIGADYEKYLSDHDVMKPDPVSGFFDPVDDDEDETIEA